MSEIFGRLPIVPVVTIENVKDAVPLARALAEGGILIAEITFRTAAAAAAIEAVRAAVPEMLVGAGTVLSPALMRTAEAAGAQFLVSPGATPELLSGVPADLPFVPGVASVSEMMVAKNNGFLTQKFFPAEVLGGVDFLKAIAAPLAGISFCATGGIGPDNLQRYLSLPNVAAVGGSWMVPQALVAEGNWAEIASLSAQAMAAVTGMTRPFLNQPANVRGEG
jgi:2-dehydro-3-deoxyphosphogluconate aldolase / (4S)-4-hydroxy-2-oxoglutarate aldolase